MLSSFLVSALLIASTAAAPIVSPTLPYNVALPGATPAYYSIPLPTLVPQSSWIKLIGATTGSANFASLLAKRQLSLKALTGGMAVKCIDGSFNEQDINSLFTAGGAGTTVLLCPSAVITLQAPIQLSAQRQTLTTLGMPTGSTRATLRVMGLTQTAAVVASCGDCHFGAIRNIQVDGSRPLLGQQSAFQSALLQVGGNALNQVVDSVRAFEPRGWSCLHGIEGANNMCSSLTITNNRFESAGHGPSAGMNQQRKRDDGVHSANQWADGISLACKNSIVTGNTIVDATDGAIVIFGAPGSLVDSNTIIAETRNTMGGINMVDMGPHAGSYVGTVVSNNKLIANNAFIKSGISLGVMVWGSIDYGRTFGGSVVNNTFSSGPNGYFSYGVSVAGFNGARVSGSKFINAKFAGIRSNTCPRATPTPGPLVFDPSTSPDASLSALPSNSTAGQWQSTPIMFLICNQPGGDVTTFSN